MTVNIRKVTHRTDASCKRVAENAELSGGLSQELRY